MDINARKILRILGLTLYWIVLVSFLGFFPVLHGWDALPEPYENPYLLFVMLVVVLAVVIAAWRKPFVHLSAVAVFMLVGVFFFFRAQAVIEAPGETDHLVLVRTTELLADEARWDRAEERECELGSATLTLYCALRQASYDVYGGFRHRRPALQVVRVMIETRRPTANYSHRLGGFNADPDVTHEDLLGLLSASLEEIDARLQ